MHNNFSELKDLIAAELSVEEIMDLLGWEMPELVEALSEHIRDQEAEFRDAVR